MVKAILFDLDGTLLPMDQDAFVKTYVEYIYRDLAGSVGPDPAILMNAVWQATAATIVNDGSLLNKTVFLSSFASLLGMDMDSAQQIIDDYYNGAFQNLRSACGYTPLAKDCIRAIAEMGYRIILATNPLFPSVATYSRIRWAGLEPEDFEYITTYENANYCKPNPEYYRQILEKLNLIGEECIMVGNDVTEDMAAQTLGIQTFLLTDCIINKDALDIAQWPHGSFPELMNFIRRL